MRKLLIVVDMQNDFITGSLGTPEAEAVVENVVAKIEEWEGNVIFTQDAHQKYYLDTREGKRLPVEHCIIGTEGQKICKEVFFYVAKLPEAMVFHKAVFADWRFPNWIFRNALKEYGEMYNEIQLVGLCTDVCVISNALLLKSHWPGIDIAVDAMCCAGTTPEAHEAALKVMRNCQVDILNWKE